MEVTGAQQNSALVLVVDDDEFIRIEIRQVMEQAGYQVAEASDGEQAIALYTRLHPDIVLLDTLMPVMDGFTCCTQLKTIPGCEHTPVLMLTSTNDRETVEQAFEAGTTDYITKPILARVLRQRVHSLLKASRATEELKRQNWRSQLFWDLTLKIRQSLQIEDILHTAVTEVQKFLQADRVVIFSFLPDGSGKVVEEAVVPGWPVVLGQRILDPCFHKDYIDKYRQGGISAVTDIEQASIQPCYVEFLQQFRVKANLVVPVFLKQKLWGLLIAHQCSSSRDWSSFETELLQQLSDQIGIALTQAQMLEEEIRYSQELARSNAELQQFASIASHDLQEPLRKIRAFGDRLEAVCGEALTSQGRDYLERMQNAAQRMQALIDDLLILSRITTRAQTFVPVNLTSVTQEVLSDLEVRIQQTRGRVIVEELPVVHADPIQMRQLMQNLIANALKFSNEQPPFVRIYSQFLVDQEWQPAKSENSELCRIIVEDNGIGFDEKYLDRIFNVFQRLHNRSEYEGTGIGLAICRKIVERHNGSITARSTLGQGATFVVTLPLSSVSPSSNS